MSKKKRNIFISLILISIIGCGYISFYIFYNRELIYKESLSIKIGDELPVVSDYFNEDNLKRLDSKKIKWNDIKLEDNKIYNAGNYDGYVTYRDNKINLKLKVIDEEAPVIENVKDITIYVNEEIDLLKDISVTDNSHDEIDIKVVGEYDIKKTDEYSLSYVAIDKSNNETTSEFKLIVKEKEVIMQNTTVYTNTSPTVTENIDMGTTTKGYTIKRINGVYYINNILIANKTYRLPSSYAPGGLLSTFNNAFSNMKNDAASQGITLNIISGYRAYSRQSDIYYNYVRKDGQAKADTYSARPGHSEHQTGLAADINSLYSSFINTAEGKWLNDNCYKYGFIIRYPSGKENITGYMYEPWHIRYVGVDVATVLYNNGNWITLEEYFGIDSKYNY